MFIQKLLLGSRGKLETNKIVTIGCLQQWRGFWWWWWNYTAYVNFSSACWPYQDSHWVCLFSFLSLCLFIYKSHFTTQVAIARVHAQPTHGSAACHRLSAPAWEKNMYVKAWLIQITSEFSSTLLWKMCRRSSCKLAKVTLLPCAVWDPDGVHSLHWGIPCFWQGLLTANNLYVAVLAHQQKYFSHFQSWVQCYTSHVYKCKSLRKSPKEQKTHHKKMSNCCNMIDRKYEHWLSVLSQTSLCESRWAQSLFETDPLLNEETHSVFRPLLYLGYEIQVTLKRWTVGGSRNREQLLWLTVALLGKCWPLYIKRHKRKIKIKNRRGEVAGFKSAGSTLIY